MDFSLSFEQQQLQSTIEKFTARHYSFDQRMALRNSDLGYSEQNWQTLVDLGLLALTFSNELGGHDGSAIDLAVMCEALGKALVVEPVLDVILAAEILANSDNHAALLKEVITGKYTAVAALYEPKQRYRPSPQLTKATKSANGYVLSGMKVAVPYAASADYFIVNSLLDDESSALFLVDAKFAGVKIHCYKTIDGKRAASVEFNGVQLSQSAKLLISVDPPTLVEQALDKVLVGLCAEALGVMEAIHTMTVDYCKQRTQFGQAIGKFQAIQHALVDMYIDVQRVRSLLYAASIKHAEHAVDASRMIAALKAEVSRCARSFGERSVQLHGAMGYTDELPLGQYFKRLICIQNQFGDEDFHLKRFMAKGESLQNV